MSVNEAKSVKKKGNVKDKSDDRKKKKKDESTSPRKEKDNKENKEKTPKSSKDKFRKSVNMPDLTDKKLKNLPLDSNSSKNDKDKENDKAKTPRKNDKIHSPRKSRKIEEDISTTTTNNTSEVEKSTERLMNVSSEKRIDTALEILENEPITATFLNDLLILLKEIEFRRQFMSQNGFEKLSVHLVRKYETSLIIQILSVLSDVFHEDSQVFEHLFAQSAVLVTTLIWLLVKLRKVDNIVPGKVYGILASLPTLARNLNFSDYEIQHMLLSALNLYNQKSFEKIRFQHLIQTLDQTSHNQLKIEIFKLINNLIRMHNGIEARMSMRLEFVALGLEQVITKISGDSSPELQEYIDEYHSFKKEDEQRYISYHQNLVLPAWIEGKDNEGLMNNLLSRWSNNPLMQSLVTSSLSNLLHIPNDEQYGLATWILLDKIITQFAVKFKQNIVEMDIKHVLQSLQTHIEEFQHEKLTWEEKEHQLLEELEGIPRLQQEVASLTAENQRLKTKIENLDTSKPSKEMEELREQVAALKKQLSQSDMALEKQKLVQNQSVEEKQKQIDELQAKLTTTEKNHRELIADEKILRMKLEDAEKQLSQTKKDVFSQRMSFSGNLAFQQPEKPILEKTPSFIEKPATSSVLKTVATFNQVTTDPEEVRLLKAISRPSGAPPARYSSSRPSTGSFKPDPLPSSGVPATPEWKKRQLEKEREEREKNEVEQKRKRESIAFNLSRDESPPKQAQPKEIPKEIQNSVEEIEKQEEQRLSRVLNKRFN